MTTAERVVESLQAAASSDAELALRGRVDWEGWCDFRRLSRWLAITEGPPPREETVRRALAQLVRAGRVEAREDQWRAVETRP
jgi:hypothetical protein